MYLSIFFPFVEEVHLRTSPLCTDFSVCYQGRIRITIGNNSTFIKKNSLVLFMIILCNTFSERDLAQDDVVALQDAKILLTTHVSELEQELKRYLLHVLVSCLNLLMVSKIGLFYCFCLILG